MRQTSSLLFLLVGKHQNLNFRLNNSGAKIKAFSIHLPKKMKKISC